jgi:hypothetical protein
MQRRNEFPNRGLFGKIAYSVEANSIDDGRPVLGPGAAICASMSSQTTLAMLASHMRLMGHVPHSRRCDC